MITLQYSSISLMLAIACVLFLIVEMVYFWGIYNRMHKESENQTNLSDTDCPPISVIIVTKDSGMALKENLPAILEQDYPFFEVIVVNDESAGEDEDILKIFEQKYTNLYHTFIPSSARYISRKKLGISMGLKASKYNWIVVTDPFSKPVSKNWLRSLASHFSAETEIVLGYSNYVPNGSYFTKHIIIDRLFQSMRFLGRALGGHPYMGLGTNMAYRKDVYESHKGFSNHLNLRRGEDDLFVNAIANGTNTRVALEPDSIVRITPPNYRRIWKDEKTSYAVTGKYYKGGARLLNSIETWSCTFFHLSVLSGITISINERNWLATTLVGLCYIIRLISVMVIFKKTARKMGENLSFSLYLFDLFRPWYSYRAKMRYAFRVKADYIRK